MSYTTKEDLKILLKQYETDQFNLDLINSIAIGYFEHYEMNEDKDDYDFFEKAYLIKKTVKSTHNFAWFLYFEWSEIQWSWEEEGAIEKALAIQKECIDLNPKSYMPYYQYGFMLSEQNQNEKAIEYLLKANTIHKKRDIVNNIGYCYFKLRDYENAQKYFLESSGLDDVENISLFNLALTEYKLGNIENLKIIAKKLEESIEKFSTNNITGYEIAILYFLLDDFKSVYKCVNAQSNDNLYISEFKEISYSFYLMNYNLWSNKINEELHNAKNDLIEISTKPEEFEHLDEDEIKENIEDFKTKIEYLTILLSNGLIKPEVDFNKELLIEYCGCLLFDCKIHENIDNDY